MAQEHHELPPLPEIDPKDIFWGILAVIGVLSMIVFEFCLCRFTLGKW
jgi:hypothetical protein